jgi:MFS family permease
VSPGLAAPARLDDVAAQRPAVLGLLLGAAGFCSNVSWQIVLPILPVHLARLRYTEAQIGLLVSTLSLTMGALELVSGRIAGTLGTRRTLAAGFLANAACLVVAGAVRSPAMVAAVFAAIGAARAVLVPPLHGAVAASSTPATRGRMFGTFWLFSSAASLLGPAAGGFVASRYGDGAPFAVGSVCSAAALPLIAALRTARPSPGGPPAADVRPLLRDPATLRLCAGTLLAFSVAGIWTTFLPLYAARERIPILVIGSLFTVQGLCYSLMQVPAGRFVGRTRSGALALTGMLCMGAVAAAVPLVGSASGLLVAAGVYGAAFGTIPATLATLATWRSAEDQHTAMMGVYNSAIDLGLFLGPLVGGALALVNGLAPFLAALPLSLAAAMAAGGTARAAPPHE